MFYYYEIFCLHKIDFELLRVLSVMKSYFLNWFMNSEEAKVLHVGDEWMNIHCSRIMDLRLVECCCDIKVLCHSCNVYITTGVCHVSSYCYLFYYNCAFLVQLCVEAVFSCLIPGGLFDSEPLYRNSNRTQEGVSG